MTTFVLYDIIVIMLKNSICMVGGNGMLKKTKLAVFFLLLVLLVSVASESLASWTAPYATITSEGDGNPGFGTIIPSSYFKKVLKVHDQEDGYFRIIAPANGNIKFTVLAKTLPHDHFCIRFYKRDTVRRIWSQIECMTFKASSNKQSAILKDVKKGDDIAFWNDDGSGGYRTLRQDYLLMIEYVEKSNKISDADIKLSDTQYVYNGSAKKPTVTVNLNGSKLKLNTDYTLKYENNTKIGTATVTVTGKGSYKGTKKVEFKIVPGTPSLSVSSKKDSSALLKIKEIKGATGYEYSYRKAGDKKFIPIESFLTEYTIEGLEREKKFEFKVRAFTVVSNKKVYGDYSKTITVSIFAGKDISGGKLTIGKKGDTYTYTGQAIFPSVKLTVNKKPLAEYVDYKLTWKKNTNAGTATVTATGVGKYRGELKGTFVIVPAKITDKMISVSAKDPLYYTGSAIKPKVTVVYKGMTLKKGTDYSVKYMNNIDAGIACVTVTGKGNFSESATMFFNIKPLPLTECEVTLPDGDVYAYTGEEVKPNVLVKYAENTIPEGETTYKVKYSNNTEMGTAKVTISGKQNMTGSVTLKFEIKGFVWPTKSTTVSTLFYYSGDYTKKPYGSHGKWDPIDIPGKTGDPIYAVADGVISECNTYSGGFGKHIYITHNDGSQTLYGHLSKFETNIKPGATVKQGDIIGRLGSSGNSTGPHLHFAWSGGNAWSKYYKILHLTYQKSVYNANNHYYGTDVRSTEVIDWFKLHYTNAKGDFTNTWQK